MKRQSGWIVPPPLEKRKPWQKLWRLPPHLYPVLAIILNTDTYESVVWIVGFDEATQKWSPESWGKMPLGCKVTHWMPLPDMPRISKDCLWFIPKWNLKKWRTISKDGTSPDCHLKKRAVWILAIKGCGCPRIIEEQGGISFYRNNYKLPKKRKEPA